MASISSRSGKLVIDFRYKKERCREKTSLEDTPQNRRRLKVLLKRIEAEITLGTFQYAKYFPESPKASKFNELELQARVSLSEFPLFSEFAEVWFSEKSPEWRKSYKKNTREILDMYLLSKFGNCSVDEISKAQILKYRSELVSTKSSRGKLLSHDRINKILLPLRMILNEASDRYEFTPVWQNIKPLKVKPSDVEPFTLEEVLLFLEKVRSDFKNYFTVRFFTGMRSSEINGLIWDNVDFERKQILISQAFVRNEIVGTKTTSSIRAIDMSSLVYQALKAQESASRDLSNFVFCNGRGEPLDHRNVSRRVWHPTLRYLKLKPRRAYQTRHTAATLWLASGESPEWIARQMGHANTNMLFKVYSRYVPNLTRQDGTVFEQLVNQKMNERIKQEDN